MNLERKKMGMHDILKFIWSICLYFHLNLLRYWNGMPKFSSVMEVVLVHKWRWSVLTSVWPKDKIYSWLPYCLITNFLSVVRSWPEVKGPTNVFITGTEACDQLRGSYVLKSHVMNEFYMCKTNFEHRSTSWCQIRHNESIPFDTELPRHLTFLWLNGIHHPCIPSADSPSHRNHAHLWYQLSSRIGA